MNNSITEDYCSYEVSKLLKLKGFGKDNPSTNYIIMYDEDGNLTEKQEEDYDIDGYCLRPTHSVAIKWFRVNFGIHISVQCSADGNYFSEIFYIKKQSTTRSVSPYFDTPDEATEASLLSLLKYFI